MTLEEAEAQSEYWRAQEAKMNARMMESWIAARVQKALAILNTPKGITDESVTAAAYFCVASPEAYAEEMGTPIPSATLFHEVTCAVMVAARKDAK